MLVPNPAPLTPNPFFTGARVSISRYLDTASMSLSNFVDNSLKTIATYSSFEGFRFMLNSGRSESDPWSRMRSISLDRTKRERHEIRTQSRRYEEFRSKVQ